MIIPYRKYKDHEGNLVQLPIVSVWITCNGVKVPVWALVDSGADISLLNMSFARIFNLDLQKGQFLPLVGVVEGMEFGSYLHQVNVTIKDVGSVDTIVAITDSEEYPSMSILGRRGFFENFAIKFEEYKKEIEITPRPAS